jgi:hypothetical protein
MRLLLIRRRCLIPTLCSPSFLIGPDVDGILNAQPFFFPGWNIIKIDANEFIYLLFCFGVKLETLERDEDWISIGRMRIFQFDSLRLGFVFIAHPAAHNSLLVDNVFPFFHVLNVCVCYLFVFSLFFWRRKTWETQTNIKNQFLFRSLVDFQLVQKHRAARHQKKKEVLPSPF